MIRKLLFVLLLFACVNALLMKSVHATTSIEKSSQTWRCLKGTNSSYNLTWHDPPSPPTLTQQLSGEGFIDGRDIYVVGCMPGDNTMCSTGETAADMLLFGKDNTTSTSRNVYGQKVTYKILTVEEGSKKRSKAGKLTAAAIVGGANAVATGGYTFFGVMINDTKDLSQPGQGAEQQGTFTFAGITDLTKCVKISWTHHDPFGIVFDSRSLEPLPNVPVTVLNENKQKVSLVGFPNPQVTQADGVFNFLVEPGNYYLMINPLPAGYSFIDNPTIHPNYNKIYYKADRSPSIYKPNEIIAEIIDTPEEQIQGYPNPERRDIPLDPGQNPPFTAFPTIMRYGVTRLEDQTEVEGKVSHPFTQITVTQNNQTIGAQAADRQGFFDILINNTNIVQDASLVLRLTKKDLTGNLAEQFPAPASDLKTDLTAYFSSLVSLPHLEFNVRAQNIQIGGFKIIQPIFSFIKGYAYDKRGNAIPKADVAIKLAMTDSTFYQTKADEGGYFEVPSQDLPIFNYDVAISSPFSADKTAYSTSEFAKANKTYLTTNKINLMGTLVKTPAKGANNTIIFSDTRTASLESNTTSINPSKNNKNGSIDQKKPLQNETAALLILAMFLIASAVLLAIAGYFLIQRGMTQQKSPYS